jgi:predicted transcriptional regulator
MTTSDNTTIVISKSCEKALQMLAKRLNLSVEVLVEFALHEAIKSRE